MNIEEAIRLGVERSPIRTLERAYRGGLGRGKLGVVLAGSGDGKTALLVQLGLDALLRGKTVLHVSSEVPVGRLRAFYDEYFRFVERAVGLESVLPVQLDVERRRLLVCQPGSMLPLARLREACLSARNALGRDPDIVIIEGFDWAAANVAHLKALQELGQLMGSEMWASVLTNRRAEYVGHGEFPPPWDRFSSSADVVLWLVPSDGRVRLNVVSVHDGYSGEDWFDIDPETKLVLGEAGSVDRTDPRNRTKYMLYSGGARGAEAAFGEAAERYGISETIFSFDGHANRVRSRGLRILSESELQQSDVSLLYVSHHLHRVFPSTPLVRKILQSIWHQIQPCQQVFAIGQILEDGTVRGGTGWGAELARRWNKELCVFDQNRDVWFRWDGTAWVQSVSTITSPHFAGIGTAHIQPNGIQAIESLFERSFGPVNA